jgi:hypothetical protein
VSLETFAADMYKVTLVPKKATLGHIIVVAHLLATFKGDDGTSLFVLFGSPAIVACFLK